MRSATDGEDAGRCSSADDVVGGGSRGRGRAGSGAANANANAAVANAENRISKSTTTTTTPPRFRSKSSPSSSSKRKGMGGGRNAKDIGFYQMAKLGYQELCNAIVRPPRSDYPPEALGPEEFDFCGVRFVRRDFGVVNDRGLLLECSMWKRKDRQDEEEGEGRRAVGGGEGRRRGGQDDDDDDVDVGGGSSNDENDHRRGQITLNVDDWDESKERGHMYLQVPESFADSSSVASSACDDHDDDDDDNDDDDYDESRDIFDRRDFPGATTTAWGDRRAGESAAPRPACRGGGAAAGTKRRRGGRTPVVIYLHGNSSGRPEVVSQLGHLLSLGVSVVAFDFAGSGKSEGEFVSLGHYEKDDLRTVVHHLRASGEVSTIGLWGRSMGAATAIMYGSRDATVSCMILDSAFTDLTRLAEEMVDKVKEQGINVPSFVVSMTLRMIKSSIKSQAGFSIRHISPISHVDRCLIPAMFVAGEHDGFISKRHSERLHARYAGDKNIVIVDGDHNSPRPRYLLQSACLLLQSCMQLSPNLELVVPMGTNLLLPPWLIEEGGGPRGDADRMKKLATNRANEKARTESSTLSDERAWLSVDDSGATGQRVLQRHRSQPSSKDCDSRPEISLEKARLRSRSYTIASRNETIPSHTAVDFAASSELPDMSKRQKDIQSSLFKILGQRE